MKREQVYHSDPETMSGTPAFVGTRVPVHALIDHLASGVSLSEFIDDLPTIRRDQAVAFLALSAQALVGVDVWPNPISSGRAGNVTFDLTRPGRVVLRIFDSLGREVARPSVSVFDTGQHVIPLDARSFPAGVYVVSLEVDGSVETRVLSVTR